MIPEKEELEWRDALSSRDPAKPFCKPGSPEAIQEWIEIIERAIKSNEIIDSEMRCGGLWINKKILLDAIKNHEMASMAFFYAPTPEGYEFWHKVGRHGHTKASLRTLKIIALMIEAHNVK